MMIHCGNCLDLMRTMPDQSVDAIITDPPYGMSYQSARRTDKTSRFDRIANDNAPFVWFLHDAARLLRAGGVLLCFCRWDSAEAFRMAIGWSGLILRSQIIWDRVCHGMGGLSSTTAPQHDTIWFATKGSFRFAGGRPKSVVQAMRLGGGQLTHPNEKPITLMTNLVLSYTTQGQVVLDPFCGSGTTGMACRNTKREFIGMELDPTYAELSRQRLVTSESIPAPIPICSSPIFTDITPPLFTAEAA